MVLYAYLFLLGTKETWIYAQSEEEARKKFARWFHEPAGELIERRTF